MNINWKLRFQNKVTLTAIILGLISLVYQICGIFNVIPPVEQQEIIDLAMMVVDLFVLVGVVVDPTTKGADDSIDALTRTEPK